MGRLWGGGFRDTMHPALEALSGSLSQDLPLADADLRASAAWALALERCGVLGERQGRDLAETLESMRADLAAGRWAPQDAEDIHEAIETEVIRRAGELGERLHTGRSRNDQVATAFRLAVKDETQEIIRAVEAMQRVLLARAETEVEALLPAYTHMQRAQPVRLGHWLLSHFWPLQRDRERLAASAHRAMVLPLGSGACTGSPFGVDREWLALQLGFTAVSENSIDAVGDRDFAAEMAFACCLVALHLSRLAEELVLWSTAEFGFARWPDSLATGSSLMPNKANPDLAELVRGRAAAAVGDLTALLVLTKGIPSGYQRDLQGDKPPVWRIAGATRACLAAMAAAMSGVEFCHERMRAALTGEILATEAADALVARGVPFRKAHRAVSQAAAEARRLGVDLRRLAHRDGVRLPEPLAKGDLESLDHEAAVERRTAIGGTARASLQDQIVKARRILSLSP